MAQDFRGFIQANAPQYLGYVGNDVTGVGSVGINTNKLKAAYGAAGGAGPLNTGINAASAVGAINDLYKTYSQQGQSGAYTGGSAGGAGATDLSAYDQSIDSTNAQLNSLTPNLNSLIGGAQNQYQTTLNGLAQNKAQTDQVYNQNKTTNSQDFVTNKNAIKTNTGNTIGSISRLAGSRGAAGQSAVDYARLLAAGQGSQQLNGAGTTFAKNQQGLDQSYGNYNQAYDINRKNADLQLENDINGAKASNATSRASLLQSLASLVNQRTSASGGSGTGASQPYVNQAQQALAEAAQYSTPKALAAQTPLTFNAPELASYTAEPGTVAVGGDAASQSATPFLASLLGRDKRLAGV